MVLLTQRHTSSYLVVRLVTYIIFEELSYSSIPIRTKIVVVYFIFIGYTGYTKNHLFKRNKITWGNFSRSGHSISTIFFHLLGEVSISLSRFLNSSFPAREQMPPQLWLERKSTGLVTWGLTGKRRKKSRSAGEISSLIRST